MFTNWPHFLLFGLLLAAVQLLAAAPWLALLNWQSFRAWWQRSATRQIMARVGIGLAVFAGAGVLLGAAMIYILDPERLQFLGRVYGAILHIQLVIDVFILGFLLLVALWPKGGAVAVASFKEGLRQPFYWLLTLGFAIFLLASPFVPYFTFGEEVKMVKEIGYDAIMLPALIFGILVGTMSVTEEIEGRTAITLMSKPLSRRQFLIGKFAGILLASLAMAALLCWVFDWVLWFAPWYDDETTNLPAFVETAKTTLLPWGDAIAAAFHGIALWMGQAVDTLPGLILGSCQIMVLLAVGVTLATRLPMIISAVSCFGLFWLGHVSPVLEAVARGMHDRDPTSATLHLVYFMAQLFNALLPGLEFFNLGPVIARDQPLPAFPYAVYLGSVVVYALMYTGIGLLLGLILFEDRDLA
jgi:hypothetical protein